MCSCEGEGIPGITRTHQREAPIEPPDGKRGEEEVDAISEAGRRGQMQAGDANPSARSANQDQTGLPDNGLGIL
jgi:hypothetical protein